ncbi:hypothetical protein BBJ29_003338 [Phytophthora kernoviae]|uniref:Uncharacterized protein n=1 Tax=Phytophthora kernoviae TaxID=325452 RepID=A0A3F2RY30_9STRA|nr:hypothetical protein BBJ29_003338 [Phytophthora kernoviae]RLN65571.1 hypothetical protein BBP00_00002753 [Phytophthora kernoviae]
MGAVLVCFGGQDDDNCGTITLRGRTPSENSFFDRLQTKLSCGNLEAEQSEDEDPINWDSFLLQSNRSTASSGSRLLSAFYSRVLEEDDDAAFFVDSRGKRMKGPYLDDVEMVEDYFLNDRRLSESKIPLPIESLEMYSSIDHDLDCFSTSSTMMSELDYWVTSDPHFEERSFEPSRPTLGRCSSMFLPSAHVPMAHKMHRVASAPNQEDAYIARFQSPWSSPSSKRTSWTLPSHKAYFPSVMGSGTLAALTAS